MPLDLLVPGVYAWLQLPGGRGRANAGAVVDADGVTVVDALATPAQYEPLAAAVEALGLPVRRLVLTSSAVEYAGGSGRFKLAAVFGSPQASVHLDQELNRATWDALYPDLAGSFDDVVTRPVSHIVRSDVQLTPAVTVVATGGQMTENLVVAVPAAEVLFAGAMCSFGTTPLCWQGDPARWADELDRLVALAPIVVPGPRADRRRGGGARPPGLPAGVRGGRRRPGAHRVRAVGHLVGPRARRRQRRAGGAGGGGRRRGRPRRCCAWPGWPERPSG